MRVMRVIALQDDKGNTSRYFSPIRTSAPLPLPKDTSQLLARYPWKAGNASAILPVSPGARNTLPAVSAAGNYLAAWPPAHSPLPLLFKTNDDCTRIRRSAGIGATDIVHMDARRAKEAARERP